MRSRRFPDPAPLPADAPAYASEATRVKYLRQKHAAMKRQAAFDAAPKELRDVWNATGAVGDALYLLRCGVRTFEDAEEFIAGR